jgi:hypothetical protein
MINKNMYDFTISIKCRNQNDYLHEIRFGSLKFIVANNKKLHFFDFVTLMNFSEVYTSTFQNEIGKILKIEFKYLNSSYLAHLGELSAVLLINDEEIHIQTPNGILMNI